MQKRIQYIDMAKFLAIFAIVFFHGFKESVATGFTSNFLLPLFFFLNGMTLKMDCVSSGEFLIKKFKGYMIPCIGLGMLAVCLDAVIRYLYNNPLDNTFFTRGIASSINQIRFLAVWFLSALFLSDIILFGIYKKCKENLWLTGVGTFAVLAFGIFYNMNHRASMVWNLDAAFFGVIYTYFGYMFTHEKIRWLYESLMRTRRIPFLIGFVLLGIAYLLSLYIYRTYNGYMIMFSSLYVKYYLTLPCGLLGALGTVFLCRGITNMVFSYPVKFNLILLASHQVFSIPLFKNFIAKKWWYSISNNPPESIELIIFVFLTAVVAVAIAAILYWVIVITPFSFILNKSRYPVFENIYARAKMCIRKKYSLV